MDGIKAANLALRFFLELGALAACGYWGFKVGESGFLKVVLGIGVPLLVVITWAWFISPKSVVSLPAPMKVIAGLLILELAAAALAAAGQATIGIIFGGIV